jgi:NAD(P)-dependent dehydrogenase (short-subunit alcohol dehydrogenase family)
VDIVDLGIGGRVAVVTGASRGIGAATALALASEGATVACCARRREDLDRLDKQASSLSGQVVTMVADLADADSTVGFLDDVASTYGPPEILVNNVGTPFSRNFLDMTDDDWRTGFDINLMAAVRCTRRVLPAMCAQGWGRVVMVSSGAARYPTARRVDYSASKAALGSFAKSMAREFGGYNILCNTVLPGMIRTDVWEEQARRVADISATTPEAVFAQRASLVPVRRFGLASEVADLIVYLASARSSYVNGASIEIDGGLGSAL